MFKAFAPGPCGVLGPTYITRAEFLDALQQQRDHFDQALLAVTAEQEQLHQRIIAVDKKLPMRAAGRLASPTRRPSQPRRPSADNDDEEHAAVRREDEAEAGTMTMRMTRGAALRMMSRTRQLPAPSGRCFLCTSFRTVAPAAYRIPCECPAVGGHRYG